MTINHDKGHFVDDIFLYRLMHMLNLIQFIFTKNQNLSTIIRIIALRTIYRHDCKRNFHKTEYNFEL